jgi:DNA phosphorothioation-dependent restriction protein DptG
MNGDKPYVIALAVFLVIYAFFMLLILGERTVQRNPKPTAKPTYVMGEDKNVATERELVSSQIQNTENKRGPILKALNLMKTYEKPDPNPREEEENKRPMNTHKVAKSAEEKAEEKKRPGALAV